MSGRLIGIGRHDRVKGPIEILPHVRISRALGVTGDIRGPVREGRKDGRQVSVLLKERWDAVQSDLGQALDWAVRRANLLVEGLELPLDREFRLQIGEACVIEATEECKPCSRMDQAVPGLKAAMKDGWRGGYLCRVIADGDVAVGDEVRISR